MSTFTRRRTLALLGALLALAVAGFTAATAGAAITPVTNDDPGATTLAQSMLANPTDLTGGATWVAVSNAQQSDVPGHDMDDPNGPAATDDSSLDGFPTTGSTFGILTTGDPLLADQPNAGEGDGRANNGSGDAVPGTSDDTRGDTDRDTSILQLNVTVPSGANCVSMDYRFLSEEFPEYVGSEFNDAFIAEIDSSTWTDSGSTISAPGDFATKTGNSGVSINGVGPVAVAPSESEGTTYDAATGLVTTKTPITPGAHKIFLSIFDQQDHIYDSAVFVDNIRFLTESASTCKPPEVAQTAPPPPGPQPGPPPPPSNTITGSSIKFKNGVTVLSVTVPGPGVVSAAQASNTATASRADAAKKKKKKKHKKPVLIRKTSVTATAAGVVKLTIRPTSAGKKLLKKKGRFSVNTSITFAPTGGTPATTHKRITIKVIKKKHHKKHKKH
jgi:hypothetical protein